MKKFSGLSVSVFFLVFSLGALADELSDTAILAENSISVGRDTWIDQGHIIVRNPATGPTLSPPNELSIGRGVNTPAGYFIKADDIDIDQYTQIGGDIYVNGLNAHNTVTFGGQQSTLTFPANAGFPLFQASTPGTQDVTVDQSSNRIIWPGRYNDISVVSGVLTLSAGNYSVNSIDVANGAYLKFEGQTVLRVAGRIVLADGANMTSQTTAADVQIYVEGQNGGDGSPTATPAAVDIGSGAKLEGSVFAPNGTIVMDGATTGALLARDVNVESFSSVQVQSAFSFSSSVPVADAQDFSGRVDTPLTIFLSASGASGVALNFQVTSAPANGVLTFVQNVDNYTAQFTYQPASGFVGNDTFSFNVSAGGATSVPATVRIRIQPSTDSEFDQTVAQAENSIYLKREVYVVSGHVVANQIATGATIEPGYELYIGRSTKTPPGYHLKGNRLFAGEYASTVGDIEYQALIGEGLNGSGPSLEGHRVDNLVLPSQLTLPPFESAPAGTVDITVSSSQPQTITEGDYRDIVVDNSKTLIFEAGVYNINSLSIGQSAWVKFEGQVTLRIADKLFMDSYSNIIPGYGSSPRNLRIYVAGVNGTDGALTSTPAAVTAVSGGGIAANVYAPNGSIVFGNGVEGFGAFIAQDISLGQWAKLILDNGFNVDQSGPGPFANSQSISLDEDTSANFELTGFGGQGALTFQVINDPLNGTVTGTPPFLTYTPAPDHDSPDRLMFIASDGVNDSELATISFTVFSKADLPVAYDANYTTDVDTPVAVTLSATDADGDLLTFSIASSPANGTLSGTSSDRTYTPNSGFSGTDSFTFTASDNSGASNVATVTIDVVSASSPPVATAQTVNGVEDTNVAFVLGATDPDGDPLTYEITTSPTSGVVSGNAPNLTYVPNADFNGTDSLAFRANDGNSNSNIAAVTFIISAVNDAPVANNDVLNLDEDTATSITLVANDIDGDALTYQITSSPTNGSLSGSGPTFTYMPAANYFGPDSFTYVANDGTEDSNAGQITLSVSSVNDVPVATGASAVVDEDSSVVIPVTAIDVESDPLSFSVSTAPSNGVATVNGNQITYTPNAGFSGADSFAFVASDATDTSSPALVAVTVTPVNNAPVTTGSTVNVLENDSVTITVTATDPDGDTLTYSIASGVTNGTLTGTGPSYVYTPTPGYSGTDSFDFLVSDGSVNSNTSTVSIVIDPVNEAPVANSASATTLEDTPTSLLLQASDADSDPLTYAIVSAPTRGVLTGSAPNLTYTPTADETGADSFTFVANDGTEDSAIATVSITISPVNDAPVAADAALITDEDTSEAITVTVTDVDGDPLTYVLLSSPANGTVTGSGPQFTFDPAQDFFGTDSFTYSANDGSVNSNVATVTITVNAVNDAPTAAGQSLNTGFEQALAIVLGGQDIDGDPLTYNITQQPANGALSGTGENRTYTPNTGFSGADQFTFTVSDGQLISQTAVVTVDVEADNQAPAVDPVPDSSLLVGGTYSVAIIASDPENDPLTFSLGTAPAAMSIDAAGVITWVTAANDLGANPIEVSVSDGQQSTTVTFQVTVTDPGASPVITSLPPLIAVENEPYNYLVEASDPDGDTLLYELVQAPLGMTIDSATGQIIWTPAEPDVGEATVQVRVSDPAGNSDEQPYEIQVLASIVNQSYLGTEFWASFSRNHTFFSTQGGGVPANSDERAFWIDIAMPTGASGTVEIPGLAFLETFAGLAGELVRVELPYQVMATAEGVLSGHGVHVVSDSPVTVTAVNRLFASTDSYLVYPVGLLGTEYRLLDYYDANNDGGQFAVTAIEDSTVFQVFPLADQLVRNSGTQPLNSDQPFSITLDAGEVYHTITAPESLATGLQIISDKPVMVTAGALCAVIPRTKGFCDYLVEQMLPDENVGAEFLTVPLATRFLGDLHRFVALQDQTELRINGLLVATMDAGEDYERIIEQPSIIESNRPLTTAQFSMGNQYDFLLRTTPPGYVDYTDPFMVQLPPVSGFLREYIFQTTDLRTPEGPISYHFVNVAIPQSALSSLMLNGMPVDTSAFTQISDTVFFGGSIAISVDFNTIWADEPFGLTVYGYNIADSYGTSGGLAINGAGVVDSVTLSPIDQTVPLGELACIDIVHSDNNGQRIPLSRFNTEVSGTRSVSSVDYVNRSGRGQYCFEGVSAGVDVVQVTAGSATSSATVTWSVATTNLAPKIISAPVLDPEVLQFGYAIEAADPNNDPLIFSLVQGPAGMTVNPQSGLLEWNFEFTPNRLPTTDIVVIRVQDPSGLADEQSFELHLIYPPQITVPPDTERDEGFRFSNPIEFEGGVQFQTEISLLESPADMELRQLSRTDDIWYLSQVNLSTSPAVGTPGSFNPLCRADVPDGSAFTTQTRWQIAGATYDNTAWGQLTDTNSDGVINDLDQLLMVAVFGNDIRIIDPVSGNLINEITNSRLRPAVAPAIADITGDGVPEILVATGWPDYRVTAYSFDGVELWQSTEAFFDSVSGTSPGTSIQVADLDNDGTPEIIAGGSVISSTTGLRLWRSEWGFEKIVTGMFHPLIRDLDGDGLLEVLYADSVYAADGTVLWTINSVSDGIDPRAYFSVANLDDDPELEVVASVVGTGNAADLIIGFEHDGVLRFGPLESRAGQIPAIGDYDGDGQAEILLPNDRLVLEGDGEVLVQYGFSFDQPFQVAVGDLNQDGLYEYVAAIDFGFEIVDVLSGAQLYVANVGSRSPFSRGHGALLIDVDRDGSSELFLNGRTPALVSPDRASWPAAVQNFPQFSAPPVWPNSVDLHIPAQTNTASQADLWVDTPQAEIAGTTYRLWTTVRNRGVKFVDEPILVELFRGDPSSGGILVGSTTLAGLGAGASERIEISGLSRSDLSSWMFARVSSAMAEPECEVNNNLAAAEVVELNISDRPTYAEQLLYLQQVKQRISAPTVTSTPPTSVNVGSEYYYDIDWQTSGTGNAALAVLPNNAPAGVQLNPFTGEIRWTPTVDQVGSNLIRVTLTDLEGTQNTHVFSVSVVDAGNQPPVISGEKPYRYIPVTTTFTHPIVAEDPEGQTLSYNVVSGPDAMTIGTDGVISWPTTIADLGVHNVVIAVTDPSGSQTLCEFILEVIDGSNLPPSIDSIAPTQAKVGFSFDYPVAASDPEGDVLSYSVVDGPSGMTFAGNTLTWSPSASQVVPITIGVSDGNTQVIQQWLLSVSAGGDLAVSLVALPNPAVKNSSINITVASINAAGPVTRALTVDGANVFLDAQGRAQISAGDIGQRVLTATVTDPYQNASATQNVDVISEGDAQVQVRIISPVDGEEINGPTDVMGSVSGAGLASWRATLLRHGEANAVEIGAGTTAVVDDVVGSIDPSMLLNGIYEIFLEATDSQGETTVDFVTIAIEGDFKIGNFSITFEDLSVPTPGIPLTVARTYDTRIRQDSLDFGHGWTLSYNDVRVQENRRPGFGWLVVSYPSGPLGLIPNQCVETNGENVVAVTMSDGDVKRFRAKAEPECTQLQATTAVDIVFEAIGDENGAKLEALNGNFGILSGGSIIEPGYGAMDPSRYKLTTEEGLEIIIEQNDGVKEIFEPEGGNRITIDDDGIIHSAGPSVTFVRDALGRIEQIIAPDLTDLDYTYDANGDLETFTDQVGNQTEFTYLVNPNLPPHYLEDIIDPRGIRVARNEYDDDGRLIAHVDADGNRIEYTHDIVGRTESIKDRNNNTTLYVYNDRGDVLVETNALGETTTRTYDENGNELTRTNDLGHTTTWTYDNLGNQLTEEDPLGNVTTSEYGPFRQFEGQRDATDTYVMFNFFLNTTIFGEPVFPGPMISTTDALGNSTGFGYDSTTGQVATITDAEGGITRTEYNADGYVDATIDARGVRTDYVLDDNGRNISATTTRTDENGVVQTLVTLFEYNDKGLLTKTTDPLGNESRTEYNAIDKPSRTFDALNRMTEYEYDDRGNLTLTRYPDLSTETMVYDPKGQVIESTDRLGRTTKMVYDAADRLVETIYPDNTPLDDTDNPRTLNGYDSAGRMTSTTNERGNVTTYGYDDAGRRTLVTDALLQETEFEYDVRGLRDATIDALDRRTTFVYDAASRLTETIYPDDTPGDDTDNLRTTMGYDNLGRKVSETDMAGLTTTFEYDPVGNLTAVVDALNQRTEYEYDEQGNKTIQRDASGNETLWAYDNLGRAISRTLPGGQSESYAYDEVGNRTSRTDFNGDVTTYTYDIMNRLTRTDYPDTTSVVNTYTLTGQLDTMTDYRGLTDYDYDERDRLIAITYPNGKNIVYTYDDAGNRTSLTTANQAVSYTFDVLNRLETVTDATGVTTYGYDLVGNRASITHANGTTVAYSYDTLNRLEDLVNENASGSVISEHHYTLGDAGNRLQMQEALAGVGGAASTVRTVDYVYDDLYRLTQETVTDVGNGNRLTTWTYDATGNRLTQTADGVLTTYTYDVNDRLDTETVGAAVTTYVYDNNGNTLSKSDGSTTTTYAYDFENRLVDVDSGATTYTYDPMNIRQSQTVGIVTTEFLVDPNRDYAQVIEEDAGTQGGLEVVYTYGDDLVNQQLSGAGDFVYLYDGLGSVRALADVAGVGTDTYVYEAFGELALSAGGTVNRYLFTGEQFDPNVGFYYLRARYYNASIGRFQTMDSFAGMMHEPASLHKYLYVHNNPANWLDPSGNITLQEIAVGISLYARQIAITASPALYLINHVATKLGSSQVANLVQLAANRFTGGIYQIAGLSERVQRLHAGQIFEKILNPAMRLLRAQPQAPILNGAARPDWLIRSKHIVDAKLGQHVDLQQLANFVKFARQEGGSITYITLTRVPPGVRQKALEAAKDVPVSFIPLTPF